MAEAIPPHYPQSSAELEFCRQPAHLQLGSLSYASASIPYFSLTQTWLISKPGQLNKPLIYET